MPRKKRKPTRSQQFTVNPQRDAQRQSDRERAVKMAALMALEAKSVKTVEEELTISAWRLQLRPRPTGSFWMGKAREGFTAACAAQPFTYVKGPLLKSWTVD
jgi:hypothetical protein